MIAEIMKAAEEWRMALAAILEGAITPAHYERLSRAERTLFDLMTERKRALSATE